MVLFAVSGCGESDVTGFTAEDELKVEANESTEIVSLIPLNFNSNNNKLYWNDHLTDEQLEKNIRYHVYKEMPEMNQYKRINITKKSFKFLNSVSVNDRREYIVLKGVDGELSMTHTNFLKVPQLEDSNSNLEGSGSLEPMGSEENDNEGGDYPIDDYLPDSES